MLSYKNSLKNHYLSVWGDDFEEKTWDKGPIKELNSDFTVLEFKPTEKRKMWTYATVGMSTFTHKVPVELHMFSAIQDDLILELLTMAAYYHSTEDNLHLDHTINFGRPWQGLSECTYGLISLPYLDGPKLELLDSDNGFKTISCYWLIPITLQERDYKIKNGLEALEAKFERSDFNYLDSNRKSIV